MKKILLLTTLLMAFSTMAAAQNPWRRTPGVNNRQGNQQQNIRQGWRSGELTYKEWAKLEKEQSQIRRMERNAKADGVVTFRERVRLNKEQNEARRHIYKQKHDGQDR
jgi:hypothetical protein